MPLTNGIKQSGSGIAALYRRYGEWLVSITWKRFIVLSLLLLFVTGILSSLPPFNWDLATRTTHLPASRSVDIPADDSRLRIKPKRKGPQAPEITKAEAKAAQAQEVAEAESLQRQVVEARMAAMQAQVEPHFLFNTLASIDHLIEVDPPRASRMQKNLIALLRASMPAMRDKATHLG